MTNIVDIHLKIKAVEYALKSFLEFGDEEQRRKDLKNHFNDVLQHQ